MRLSEAQKLVLLAALRLAQDGNNGRSERILTLESASHEAQQLLVNSEAMDELWDALNENPVFVGFAMEKKGTLDE